MSDKIDDLKSCSTYLKGLSILVSDRKEMMVHIRRICDKRYPGSEVAIRINNERPFRANEQKGFDFKTSSQIVQRLKTNPVITVRYYKWPDNDRIDETFQVFGFPEMYEYLQWAVSHIQ